jgi:large subunit ribosomal protein L10
MAITRDKKTAIIADISDLLGSSKMTVLAEYTGLSVGEAQELRRNAKTDGTVIRVAKNRLVKIALAQSDQLKDVDTSALTGQIMYAFNADDEVSPAKALATFAKDHPQLKLVGAFNAQGDYFDADEVKRLSDLPNKDQLRAQLVGTMAAPISGFANVLAGNIRGLANVLNARATALGDN